MSRSRGRRPTGLGGRSRRDISPLSRTESRNSYSSTPGAVLRFSKPYTGWRDSTVAEYRGAYVPGLFEEVTEDYGVVIQRINAKFGTEFSPFLHTKNNLRKVFARIDQQYEKTQGVFHREARISRPSVVREQAKVGVEYETKDPKRRQLISEAETIYAHLIGPET